ncbi:MAG: alanine dehydrogenase [Bacteroidetes bacterium]|nr:alanine dehydrogenase [Bacteroidota bacterium]
MKLALIRERKNPPDRRVVLSPIVCKRLMQLYPDLTIKVESSQDRIFSDKDYQDMGIEVTNNIADCDVFVGVKEVPVDDLIPNKKYFFFSHTIKKQKHNQKLLKAILDKNISLYDHETITDAKGVRLVAFGKYAGIVGAYNAIRAYGLKHQHFKLPKAETLHDKQMLITAMQKISFTPFKIVLTGTGRVGNGAKEMLDAIPLKEVSVDDFLTVSFNEAVYVQIDVLDYAKRKDGQTKDIFDFFNNFKDYENNFERFAQVADLFIAGHFYADGSPMLVTNEIIQNPAFSISVIADISCDVGGPIASTIKASTIANPIYGYSKKTLSEVDYLLNEAIAVMAVDNLPCELPKDASEGFAAMFSKHVIPSFFNGDVDGILQRALIASEGKLTQKFKYLQNFVDGN